MKSTTDLTNIFDNYVIEVYKDGTYRLVKACGSMWLEHDGGYLTSITKAGISKAYTVEMYEEERTSEGAD